MKFEFKSWIDASVIATQEIPDDTAENQRCRVALEMAVKAGIRLTCANLDDASLVGASLRSIRTDLFDVLLRAQPEVPALLAALRAGRIDGSTYSGECACLVGTIAKARHCDVEAFDFRDARRPIERWFTGIRPGDTPDKHAIARITEGWILEFMALTGIKDEPVAP